MAKIVKSVQKYDAKVFANINLDTQFSKIEEKNEDREKAFMSDLKKSIEGEKKNEDSKYII